jgi:hypothetical protein
MPSSAHRRLGVCVASLAALALVVPSALPAADLSANYTFKQVKLGGGGWVTGVVVHPGVDNLVYCRTDVGGAYKWDAANSRWTQLITVDRVPAAVYTCLLYTSPSPRDH